MRKIQLATAVALTATALAVNVNAADIRWNGFASITGGLNLDYAERSNGTEIGLYGYDEDVNFRPETKLALQASSNLGNGFSVTAQAIARGADDYNAEFEWAYVSYDFGDASRINFGKLRIPFYLYSDFLDVGYAYPWISPPESVYDLFTASVDGVSLQLNGAMGSWDSGLQIVAGRQTDTLTIADQPAEAELVNLWGAAWTVNNDWLTLRAAYFQTQLTVDAQATQALFTTLRCVPSGTPGVCAAEFPDQADDIEVSDDKGAFTGVGFKVDKNNWLLNGEYTQIRTVDNYIPEQDSTYIMAGRRFGSVTLFVTYEIEENTPPTGKADGIFIPGLAAAVNGIVAAQEEQSTTMSLGMRYDFHPSAALKVDFSQRDWDSSQTLDVTGSAQVLRVSIDTVF